MLLTLSYQSEIFMNLGSFLCENLLFRLINQIQVLHTRVICDDSYLYFVSDDLECRNLRQRTVSLKKIFVFGKGGFDKTQIFSSLSFRLYLFSVVTSLDIYNVLLKEFYFVKVNKEKVSNCSKLMQNVFASSVYHSFRVFFFQFYLLCAHQSLWFMQHTLDVIYSKIKSHKF